MIKELYVYSCPKLSENQKNIFNWFHILCVALFSSLTAIFGNIAFAVVLTVLYLGLSLLAFINKDFKSRYMMLVSLCIVDISIVSIYLCTNFFPEYDCTKWAIIGGILFCFIYEIVVFVKIKNKAYSSPSPPQKASVAISATALLGVSLLFGLLYRNPQTQFMIALVFMLLCATIILVSVISVQKTIVFFMVKNKVQNSSIKHTNI